MLTTTLLNSLSSDGKPLKDGVDGVKIEELPDGTHRLTLPKSKGEDQGNYKAEATNDAGSVATKAPLTIKGM